MVSWSSSGCSNVLQPLAGLFLSWAAKPEQVSVFVGAVSAKGFPCSLIPHPTTGFSMRAPAGLSLTGLPGLLDTDRDFVLGVGQIILCPL